MADVNENENKKALSEAQKSILSKVISKRDSSTFVLCINEEQEAAIEELKHAEQALVNKQLTDDQTKALNELRDNVLDIHKHNIYCAHCGKLAKVDGDLKNLSYTCDCDDSKKELDTKKSIEAQHAALDKEFYDTQIAATNKAIKLYKEHYKDVIEFRKKAFQRLDDDILNAAEL